MRIPEQELDPPARRRVVRNLAAPVLRKKDRVDQSEPKLFEPKVWQAEAFERLRSQRLSDVHAPTGSGKTALMAWMAQRSMDDGYRALIVVPTHEISAGFRQARRFDMGGGRVVTWAPGEMLEDGRKNQLAAFLRGKVPGTIIATHACLSALDEIVQGSPGWLNGFHLFVDEAHHVQHDGKGMRNHLGRIVDLVVRRSFGGKTRLTLATATPFRGDQRDIVPEESRKHFTSYVRSIADHLQESGIDQVRYHLVTYRAIKPKNVTDYPLAIPKVYEVLGDGRRGIAYMPHTSRSTNHKLGKDRQLTRILKGPRGASSWPLEKLRVGNMVDQTTQRQVQNEIYLKRSAEQDLDYDVLVAMNLGREGLDWPAADYVVMLDPAKSLTQNIQQAGRLMRPYPGKSAVDVVLVSPTAPKGADHEASVFERYMKAVHLALLGEQVFNSLDPLDGRTAAEQEADLVEVERRTMVSAGTLREGETNEQWAERVRVVTDQAQAEIWDRRSLTPRPNGGARSGGDTAGGDSRWRAGKLRQGTDQVLRVIAAGIEFYSDAMDFKVIDTYHQDGDFVHHLARIITPATLRALREQVLSTRLTLEDYQKAGRAVGLRTMLPDDTKPEDVPRSNELSWWKCDAKGHETKKCYSSIKTDNTGCGKCNGKRRSFEEVAALVAARGKCTLVGKPGDPAPKAVDHPKVKCNFCLKISKTAVLDTLLHGQGLQCCRYRRSSATFRKKGRIIITDDGRVFQSTTTAAEKTGAWGANIIRVIQGKRSKAAGLTFRYATPAETKLWEAAGCPELMEFPEKP